MATPLDRGWALLVGSAPLQSHSCPMEVTPDALVAHAITCMLDVLTINKSIHQYRDLLRLYARTARSIFLSRAEEVDFEDVTPLDNLCRYFQSPEILKDKYELLKANQVEMLDEYILTIWGLLQEKAHMQEILKQKLSFAAALELVKKALEPVTKALPAELQTHIETLQNRSNEELRWMNRPFMAQDYTAVNREIPQVHISQQDSSLWNDLPAGSQEYLIMEELLGAFVGIEGKRIYLSENPKTGRQVFTADSSLSPSLASLISRLLPICDAYVEVNSFVQAYTDSKMGQVANAMASIVTKILVDWQLAVTQYEQALIRGKLSLQNLWNNMQLPKQTLLLVRDICVDAASRQRGGVRGGQLLNLVHERFIRTAGDNHTQSVFIKIIQAASQPYWEMLKLWIFRGVIRDPHEEFLVQENRLLSGSAYSWEDKFSLRDSAQIPQFLEPVAVKILMTGKYLDIIRECNIESQQVNGAPLHGHHHAHDKEEFEFQAFDRAYLDKIERAYANASSRLLHLLQSEYKLLDKLRAMKRYFLLDQSDFCSHFMDIAGEELKKKSLFASAAGLQASLDLALRSSAAKGDPFAEDLLCGLHPRSLGSHIMALSSTGQMTHLTLESSRGTLPEEVHELFAFELFTLDYQPGWPLRLIFHERAMSKYQAVFRQLFYLRHVERALCQSWQTHQSAKELFAVRRDKEDPDTKLIYRAYALRQRMLHLVQTLQWYMTATVIETQYNLFEQELMRATTVEELILKHDRYLDSLIGQCLLRIDDVAAVAASLTQAVPEESQLPRILIKLLTNCVLFANFTDAAMSKMMATSVPDSHLAAAAKPQKPGPPGKKSAAQAHRPSVLNKARLRASELAAKASLSKQGFEHTLGRFEFNFGRFLTVLMRGIAIKSSSPDQDSASLSRILEELDVNDYYNKTLLGGEF